MVLGFAGVVASRFYVSWPASDIATAIKCVLFIVIRITVHPPFNFYLLFTLLALAQTKFQLMYKRIWNRLTYPI